MLDFSHLKKVLVGSAFAGAFFIAAPAASAQDLPEFSLDSAGIVDQVRGDLADWGIATAPVDSSVTDQVDTAVNNAVDSALDALPQEVASEVMLETPLAEESAVSMVEEYAEMPATNPNPLGIDDQLKEATQPEFKPLTVDPNYVWRNDTFSKVMAAKPAADYVLHRVPGSYFDAPRIPHESNESLAEGKSLYGPGTPIYVNDTTMCTLTAAGYDAEGHKVGITAGHCGEPGDSVASADSWQAGASGTVVSKNEALDYSVIEFGSNAEVSNTYNGVTAHKFGGEAKPGDVTCKRGVASGTTCGVTFAANDATQLNQVCAMVGDSGAPLFHNGAIVGTVSGGVNPLLTGGVLSCFTPLQGAIHSPTMATDTNAIKQDMDARGGVGAGFYLPRD